MEKLLLNLSLDIETERKIFEERCNPCLKVRKNANAIDGATRERVIIMQDVTNMPKILVQNVLLMSCATNTFPIAIFDSEEQSFIYHYRTDKKGHFILGDGSER